MRLIDADALIEFVEGRYTVTWNHDYDGGIKDACIDILNFIDNAPTIDAMPCWIPCEEKLPEDGKTVLISYRYKRGEGDTSHVYISITSYGRIWSNSIVGDYKDWRQPFQFFHSNYEVIAWMPLPEPYDGERRDDE